ncbi:MAG: formylglycine-generating enzyme family protein [Elusimicrobiota bacterium]
MAAGACPPAHVSDGKCWVFAGRWYLGGLPDSFRGDDQPAVCMDWEQARTFAEWVGGRLPSEAEWEYAARGAGRDFEFPWGNAPATCEKAATGACGGAATAPVCSRPAGDTTQGLCDMGGDAAEWMQDWFHDPYDGAPSDGRAWEDDAPIRVGREALLSNRYPYLLPFEVNHSRTVRGGSWFHGAEFARCASRFPVSGRFGSVLVGLRPAR